MSELYLPFIFQGLFMLTDEFHFHHRRGLPLWERVGHPLDSLTTLVALLIPAFFEYSKISLNFYVALSLFSCIFITKDEFIHKDLCSKTEQWLHSILFILHPLTFSAAFYIWKYEGSSNFLKLQTLIILFFMLYQIIGWSLIWKPLRK